MILIITTEYERAVTNVTKWLKFYDIPFVRMTLKGLIEAFYTLDIETKSMYFKTGKINFNLDDIKVVWIRKANFDAGDNKYFVNTNFNKEDLVNFLNQEIKIMTKYIFNVLQSTKPCIGYYSSVGFNKLIVLSLAKKIGLNIPCTKIITSQEEFTRDKNKKYITKPISEIFVSKSGKNYFSSFTSCVNFKDLTDEVFFPSLIQNLIVKKHDLRVFVVGKEIYAVSIALFNNSGNTDWRHISNINDIQFLSYKLPSIIEKRILSLMGKLRIGIGALDLIEDNFGKIYFIEINPDGDFEMIQNSLGINIDEKIATYIINIQNEKCKTKRDKTSNPIQIC